jgi:hypothetical protein
MECLHYVLRTNLTLQKLEKKRNSRLGHQHGGVLMMTFFGLWTADFSLHSYMANRTKELWSLL